MMSIPQRLASNLRLGRGAQILLVPQRLSSSSSTSKTCFKKASLPGGFNADGLRDWAVLNNFGADGVLTGQALRRRRRKFIEGENSWNDEMQPYVDLFSRQVSDECSDYLASHPSPSAALGRAFFGSKSFMGEKVVLSSLNTLFSSYPEGATTLPTHFKLNEQYLQWKVTVKAPLELICAYQLGGLNFRGCTMLAFDPKLRKVYHGNCIDVLKGSIQGFFPETGIQMHVKYAEFLLDGMVDELENVASEKD